MMPSKTILIPVYIDQNGIHQVQLFRQMEDGTYRRTGEEPLRALRENITGITARQGQLISPQYDRSEREWSCPTITLGARPYSLYGYLREALKKGALPVAVAPSIQGRLFRFDIHHLTLKPSLSLGILRLMKQRYGESLELWDHPPLQQAAS